MTEHERRKRFCQAITVLGDSYNEDLDALLRDLLVFTYPTLEVQNA